MNNRSNKLTTGRKPKGRKSNTNNKSQHEGLLIVKPSWGIAPPRTQVTLRYWNNVSLVNVGVNSANKRFNVTNAYDIDPTIGSTSLGGFVAYATLYRFYRVIAYKAKARCSNLETFPVTVFLTPFNVDPGANANNQLACLTNPRTSSATLGPLTGNGIATISQSETVWKYGGSMNPMLADVYSGSTTGSSPTNNMYVELGSYGTANGVSGVLCELTIDITLQFFELQDPSQ